MTERLESVNAEPASDEPTEAPLEALEPPTPRRALGPALVRAIRPEQWVKNLLVLAAPAAAGVLTDPASLATVALAFVAFCLVASGGYLLNDARDAEADRRHPSKRRRPIAAGEVSEPLALVVGLVLLLAGLGVAAIVHLALLGIVALYILTTASYTLWLKDIAVLDLAMVASGFVIRAVAGGLAVGVPISRYFLIVASFGSLMMVAGKRHGEHLDLGPERGDIRATLSEYPREYLRFVWTMAVAVTITAYCLWAFEQQGGGVTVPLFELSIIPFVLFVLRYALLLGLGRGSAPEELMFSDRGLQAAAGVWIVVYGAGVYIGG